MTFVAGPACKWRMNICLEEFWILGRMRIVAAPAVHHRCIDINVGFLERIGRHIVALAAKLLDGLHEQPIFCRHMRLVTDQAIARGRRVVIFLA